MRSTLDVVAEISMLVRKFPKRDAAFENLKAELAPKCPVFCVLCPTAMDCTTSRVELNGQLQCVVSFLGGVIGWKLGQRYESKNP